MIQSSGMWPIAFRHGSWDQKIWESVRCKNEYGIIERFEGCVIDIGAHVGAFSSLAELIGASQIIAVEPDQCNRDLLRFNSRHMIESGKMVVYPNAIAAVDGDLFDKVADTWPNTGGAEYRLHPAGGVVGISLDTLLSTVDMPVLVKLDCEGAEFAALKASQLKNVVSIVGEYHGIVDSIRDDLIAKGFAFSSHSTGERIGLFGANRKLSDFSRECFLEP